MAIREQSRPIYQAFREFIDRCVRRDRSLLWPEDQVWTVERLQTMRERLIDAPVFGGDLSFEEKLLEQLRGADPRVWKIIADVYFVYFLPSTFIKVEKKINDVSWAAATGGFRVPPADAEIWAAQDAGYTRTSLKYHTKYAQFWLVILFALRTKQSDDAERVLTDPLAMQSMLDGILDGISAKMDRAYDMRHAILYMSFPDEYERIISTRDKERIVEKYGDHLDEVPDDLDQALRDIRQALPQHRGDLGPHFDFYDDVREEWRPKKRPKKVQQEDVEQVTKQVRDEGPEYSPETNETIESILATLTYSRNLILYGPPGTGKTFIAHKVAEILAKPRTGEGVSQAVKLQEVAGRLTFYELLALGMYMKDPDGRHPVPELQKLPIIDARFAVSPVKRPGSQIWGYMQSHSTPASETVKIARRSEPYLFDKDEESRWLLTEAGKTYVEENLGDDLGSLTSGRKPVGIEAFIEWVTFHQSYAYEEFIEGLRPVPSEEEPGAITYEVVPGAFKRIATKAAADPDNNYVLVIDEINRGNIAKIFGELITLIEDDKRSGEENALSIALAYSPDRRFSVPSNLYIIGTMNTADRSIALLDLALRRRFSFEEIMPQPELLDGVTVDGPEATVQLGGLLRALNEKLRSLRDRDHQIGHSYFLKVRDAKEVDRVDMLEYVWNRQIMPLLQEYFYSQPERLLELLAPMYPEVSISGTGAPGGGLTEDLDPLSGDELLFALSSLVGQRASRAPEDTVYEAPRP